MPEIHLPDGSICHIKGMGLEGRLHVGVKVVISPMPMTFTGNKWAEAIDVGMFADLENTSGTGHADVRREGIPVGRGDLRLGRSNIGRTSTTSSLGLMHLTLFRERIIGLKSPFGMWS